MHAPPLSNPNDAMQASRLRRLTQRAETFRQAGQKEAAIQSLEAALQLQPDSIATNLAIAELQLEAGRHNPAREAALRALQGHFASPRLALDVIHMLNRLSESGLIVELARQLPPQMWDSAKSLAEIAQALSMIGAHDLARAYAREAVRRDPNHPPSLVIHATMDVYYGDLESAAEHAERCLQFIPDDPGAHWLLSRLRLPDGERRVARIQRELDRGVTPEVESWLAYAQHNELHDMKDYDRAWVALERACRAKRTALGYDPAAAAALFEQLLGWTAEEVATPDGYEDPRLTPIFVIGLHRSGTTLTERIISGHSQVKAGGETYDIRAQLRRASGLHFTGEVDPRVVQARAGLDYRAIGEGFLRGIAWRAEGAPYVTDKLPSNYYNVGFIARALPRARFVNLRRDPINVGLSSLRTLFSHACPYSYDQDDFVQHHRNYERLMAHWHRLLPDRILDVHYDDLVNAPEVTTMRIAQFCGLQYEPAMVKIESRSEAVSTASSVMMRDGIRRDRGEVWKAYERQLQPMIRGLESAPP